MITRQMRKMRKDAHSVASPETMTVLEGFSMGFEESKNNLTWSSHQLPF